MNLDEYLKTVVQHVQFAREWILDGWGLDGEPSPEQLAAAMLMEARTQDADVEAGRSDPSYPRSLRQVAFTILALAHPSVAPSVAPTSRNAPQHVPTWEQFCDEMKNIFSDPK